MQAGDRHVHRPLALLAALAACPAAQVPPSDAPTAEGTVLYIGDSVLLVQHDDTRGRTVAGVTRYAVPGELRPADLDEGHLVRLWVEPDTAPLAVDRLEIAGRRPLPERSVAGGHDLKGTVVRRDDAVLTIDHGPVPGVMPPMVMPFRVGTERAEAFAPGDQLTARLVVSDYGMHLEELERTGRGDTHLRGDIQPLRIGDVLPATEVVLEDGSSSAIGAGQGVPTALAFLYTRCPDPTFCPLLASRLAALQGELAGRARIVTVTLDPDHDTPEVLAAYGARVGADPSVWRLGRVEPLVLDQLALRSGLSVTVQGNKIAHRVRMLVLDADGRLLERYDDNDWPRARVASQLASGGPAPLPGTEAGTLQSPAR